MTDTCDDFYYDNGKLRDMIFFQWISCLPELLLLSVCQFSHMLDVISFFAI